MNPIGGIFSIKITKDFKEQKGQLNNIMPQQNNEFGAPHQKVKEIVKFVMLIDKKKKKQYNAKGSGCGSVGRMVPSYTRVLQFKSSYRETFILNTCFLSTVLKKMKIKKKMPNWPIFVKKRI